MAARSTRTHLLANLSWYVYAFAAVPLLLVLLGGAVGGFIGGLSCWLILKVWKSPQPFSLKLTLTLLTYLISFVVFGLIAIFIQLYLYGAHH